MTQIELVNIKKSDIEFLYDLLENRDSRTNISHKKMPSFEQHVKFVSSKPYQKWYIITNNKIRVGSIYLSKQDEIGIFIEKKYQNKGIGKKAIIELMKKNPKKRFLANVSPKNKKSMKFFKRNGFKLIQHTLELESITKKT